MTKWRWNYSYHLWFKGNELVFVSPDSKGIVVPKVFALSILMKLGNGFSKDDFINYAKDEIQNPEEVFSDLVTNRVILEFAPIKVKVDKSKKNLEDNLTLEQMAYGAHEFGLKMSSVLQETTKGDEHSFVLACEEDSCYLLSSDTNLELHANDRFFKVLSLQESRYDSVFNLIQKYGYKAVLDFGCGEGGFLHFLQSKKSQVEYFGTDIHPKRLNKAIQKFGEKFFITKTDNLNVSLTLMLEVLEHMSKEEALELLQEHLGAGRDVLLTMPNKAYDLSLGFHTSRHPEHIHEWTESELEQIVEEFKRQGFEGNIWKLGRPLDDGIQPTLGALIRSYHERKLPLEPQSP